MKKSSCNFVQRVNTLIDFWTQWNLAYSKQQKAYFYNLYRNLRKTQGRIENKREIENPDPLGSVLHRIELGESFPMHYRSYLYDGVLVNFFYGVSLWKAKVPVEKKHTSRCFRKIPNTFPESSERKLSPRKVSAWFDHSCVRGWSLTTTNFWC